MSTMDVKEWGQLSSQQPPTAMDSLSVALKGNIIPNQEYLLQGSVLDSAVEILLHRLRGLCDNVDSGPETFHDHEMCFSIRGSSPQPLLLRVRRALDTQDAPWQLRYIGQPELGAPDAKSRPTIVRSSIDIGTSSTVVDFLTELGCRLDFEYIVRGYMFCKGRMKITVSKIYKMGQGKPPESLEPVSQSYLVELSVLAPSGQDAIADDMRAFADQLRPLVILEKVDYKRLPLSAMP
ncbi:hypothetical protein LSTR_LSTR011424 [Laodelphax striatellus]|uniref:Mediator of RNA polymerase II transcription subunit 18 n=1 Tax=Laodelphax striatellus TaxID=195883 RepID=A0A482WPI1_LAOST|nr:hypothetical protein LSTR_LSTR011424 [Laodelphax striatellus]